jgi:pimeloyl-ACP methyl ester carboxylesterase
VARELSADCGVLEPLQTATSLEGQVEELRGVLSEHGTAPFLLIGHSWGAWLAFIVAAKYPEMVNKLVLVGSGPFEAKHLREVGDRRRSRLTPPEQVEFDELLGGLEDPKTADKDSLLARLGALVQQTDNYDLLPETTDKADELSADGGLFHSVWLEADVLRRSGELLRLADGIRCPVLAIHGDVDPHPAAGVKVPLSRVLRDFRFVQLERCGHSPWKEKHARDKFYKLVRHELSPAVRRR